MRLQVEYVDPATLTPAPWNPRKIDGESLKRLGRLIELHGFVDPVIARRTDRLIIGGHQRLKANAMLGEPAALVPCIFLDDVTDERAKALNIALNSPDASGDYDTGKLGALLDDLTDLRVDVPALTGLRTDTIAELIVDPTAFAPDPAEATRLDQRSNPVTCPNCGHEF